MMAFSVCVNDTVHPLYASIFSLKKLRVMTFGSSRDSLSSIWGVTSVL